MSLVRASLLSLACVLGTGCTLSNMTPQARFQDAAHTLNDAARWGQVDIASRYVAASYMDSFLSRHRNWGEQISISDADLVRLKLAEDRGKAMSEVSVDWYDTHGIDTRRTVVTQQWESHRGSYVLIGEVVRSGDPRLFAEDLKPEDDASSGGSAEP